MHSLICHPLIQCQQRSGVAACFPSKQSAEHLIPLGLSYQKADKMSSCFIGTKICSYTAHFEANIRHPCSIYSSIVSLSDNSVDSILLHQIILLLHLLAYVYLVPRGTIMLLMNIIHIIHISQQQVS